MQNRFVKWDATLITRVPYPEPQKSAFPEKNFLIPGGICQIHGVVPHYLYLAIRTSARHGPNHVHKSPDIPRDARALEKAIAHSAFTLPDVVRL